MGKYICQRPIHPGELLKEETEERKLSQRRLRRQRCSSRQLWVSALRY